MAPNRQLTVSPLQQTDSYVTTSPIKERERLYKQLTNANKCNISESKTHSVSGCTNFMPPSNSDESDGGDKGIQGNSGSQDNSHNSQGNSSGSSGREDKRNKPPELTKAQVTQNEEDMKVESKRIKTFSSSWPHKFLSPEALAAAGFYFVRDDIVRCPFCKIEVGRWEEEDIPKKEHRRWSGNCPFIRGIPCGNVPINESGASCSRSSIDFNEDVAMQSYDTCGIHEEMRPFAFCDNEVPSTSSTSCSLPFIQVTSGRSENSEGGSEQSKSSLEKLGVKDVRAPVHMQYSTEASRLASYTLWPVSIKQRPNALSEAGFYYTGNGDQTVCFHCGGGLKDWEEGDDPWVEHAKWFSKCHFLNLVKGSEFIAQVTGSRPALLTAEEVKGLSNQCSVAAGQETASNAAVSVGSENNVKSSPSHLKTATVEATENSKESKEVKDEGRLCKICYNAELGVVFLPCGHMVACVRCAPSLSTCPVCRQPFTHTVRAFLS